MRYMPFNRGLNQIFKNYAVSEDPQVTHILSNAADDDFNFEFWKRSENGLVEIDGFIPLTSVGIDRGKIQEWIIWWGSIGERSAGS